MKKYFEYFIWRGLPALVNVISIIALSRLFGEAVFGFYNLFFSTIVFVKTLSLNWVTMSAQRFYYEDEEITFPSSVALSLLSSVPAALLFATILPEALQSWWVLVLGAAILFCEGLFELALVRHRLKFLASRYGKQLLLRSILFLILGLASAHAVTSPGALAVCLLASIIIPLGIFGRTALAAVSLAGTRLIGFKFLKFGLPVAAATAVSMQFMLVVKYALARSQDIETVGAFSVTSDIMQNGFFVLMLTVTLGLHPRLTKIWSAEQRSEFLAGLKRLSLTMLGLGITLFLVLLLLRPFASWVLAGSFLEMFDDVAIPMALIYVFAILKVGVLDFLLGLNKQVALQITISLGMLLAIFVVAQSNQDIQSMLWGIVAVVAITILLEVFMVYLGLKGSNIFKSNDAN